MYFFMLVILTILNGTAFLIQDAPVVTTSLHSFTFISIALAPNLVFLFTLWFADFDKLKFTAPVITLSPIAATFVSHYLFVGFAASQLEQFIFLLVGTFVVSLALIAISLILMWQIDVRLDRLRTRSKVEMKTD